MANPRQPFKRLDNVEYDSDQSSTISTNDDVELTTEDDDNVESESEWSDSENYTPLTALEHDLIDEDEQDNPAAMSIAFPDGYNAFLKQPRDGISDKEQ